MDESIAHPPLRASLFELPAWKTFLSVSSAAVLALLFLSAGIWKLTDPFGWAVKVTQLKVPEVLSMPATLALGIGETFAGALLLVPRFRRWGAWLAGVMLVVFMVYVGVFYTALQGEDCSCFPWLKRSIGPGFFVGDALMLALAAAAGVWARPSHTMRCAALMLGVVAVFGLVSYGVAAVRMTGAEAPASITVDGKPYDLRQGKVLVYFFDPECAHCDAAARAMAKLPWGDTRIVAVPYAEPRFGPVFLRDTGLKAGLSNDLELLHGVFPKVDGPHAVALENGRQKAFLTKFDGGEPEATLRGLGFLR